jgi:hypothetical protein
MQGQTMNDQPIIASLRAFGVEKTAAFQWPGGLLQSVPARGDRVQVPGVCGLRAGRRTAGCLNFLLLVYI